MSYCRNYDLPAPENLTFPEDIAFGSDDSNWKICDTSDGSIETIIACIKFHISETEWELWKGERDCPGEEMKTRFGNDWVGEGKLQEKLELHRKIFSQYENKEVSPCMYMMQRWQTLNAAVHNVAPSLNLLNSLQYFCWLSGSADHMDQH